MVGRPKSQNQKNRKASTENAMKMQAAVEAWKEEVKKSNPRSLRCFAADMDVDRKTLKRQSEGGQSIQDFNSTKQTLTPAEEATVADWITRSCEQALPPTPAQIRAHAEYMRKTIHPQKKPIGTIWVNEFFARHPEVSTGWINSLDIQRAQALNPVIVKSWFDLLESEVVAKNVPAECQWGMDEMNLQRGNLATQRVAKVQGKKMAHKQGGANKEMITAIVTIGANGEALAPTLIFKGERIYDRWIQDNPANATFVTSLNGWTDQEVCKEWLQDVFEPATQEKANGQLRVLYMDGHSSHFTTEIIDFAMAFNIMIVGYPPHCTHALQGLDVVCFAKMKSEMKKEINEFEATHGHSVRKDDLTGMFGRAFLRSFDVDTVMAAFQKTGIYPFNRNAITEEQMKPAEATSVQGSFTFTQTSPIKAIIKSFRVYKPTRFDISPSHATSSTSTPDTPSDLQQLMVFPSYNEPQTPNHSRSRSHPDIDPALLDDTPSKRMRIAFSSLSSTSSTSFLVSQTPYTSDTPFSHAPDKIPADIQQPDWTLKKVSANPRHYCNKEAMGKTIGDLTEALGDAELQVKVLKLNQETMAAQAVIADLHLQKMNQIIYSKEQEKIAKEHANNKFVLPNPGHGHIWTKEAVADTLKKKKEAKEKEAAEQAERVRKREETSQKKAALELEWKNCREEHKKAVEAWQEDCKKACAAGIKTKDLPSKPKCIKKKALTTLMMGTGDAGDEDVDDSDAGNVLEDEEVDAEFV
ncbi:hypothetical protein D9758_006716 [Tetrapyrgos nigripes]|uniref:HTH CENPB-type domain-containing protein n=1 Tax=Tetrapyrgos nigripes TaxID=182062 RepID=A0A8H5GJ06_9AGAR|nr:hypothetical protein D9758_006716 [Tetrapyrgos nigripes]